MLMENVQRRRKSARVPAVGRKVKPLAGEDIIVGFKAASSFVEAIDQEADRMTSERQTGSSKVSRSEAIKVLISEALAARAKARGQA